MKNYNNLPPGTILQVKKEDLEALFFSKREITKKEDTLSNYLTLAEAADFLGVKKATLYKMTSKKQIKYSKAFGKCYFLKENLIEIIKSGEQQTQQEASAEVLNYIRKNHKK